MAALYTYSFFDKYIKRQPDMTDEQLMSRYIFIETMKRKQIK